MSENEKCGHCGKTKEKLKIEGVSAFFYGQDEKTQKKMMLCGRCFYEPYELVPGQKENVFRKKKETK